MAYNKAKEEKKWRLWKEAEEKQLRNLGVNEDDIEKLRIHDWAIFNSDRRYYQRVQETGTYLDELAEDTTQPEVKTVEDFLDSIENQHLYRIKLNLNSKLNCHSFRHAFATHLYESGTDLLTLKELLGHKSINSTVIYVHLASYASRKIYSPFDQLNGGFTND